MTTPPPPPSSDETPEELDEFLARRVRRALHAVEPTPASVKADHIAAALAAFDDVDDVDDIDDIDDIVRGPGPVSTPVSARHPSVQAVPELAPDSSSASAGVTTLRPRQKRSWYPAIAAASLVIVVGAVFAMIGGGEDMADRSTTASAQESMADGADRTGSSHDAAGSGSVDAVGGAESSEQSSGATPHTSESAGADPVDIGDYSTLEQAADAARAILSPISQDLSGAATIPEVAAPSDVVDERSDTPNEMDASEQFAERGVSSLSDTCGAVLEQRDAVVITRVDGEQYWIIRSADDGSMTAIAEATCEVFPL